MPFQFRKEAIEEDLNSNFPSQGQGNPPLYYSLSEVVVPTYSINAAAEGSTLPDYLQTSLDFGVTSTQTVNTTNSIITNTGFWRLDYQFSLREDSSLNLTSFISISDGISSKRLVAFETGNTSATPLATKLAFDSIFVFVKSGETVSVTSPVVYHVVQTVCKQVATVNGTLVNPLGFSAA